MKHYLTVLTLFFFLSHSSHANNNDEVIVTASDDSEITIERFAADGDYLIVMTAPEYGFRDTHRDLARLLVKQNIEVWLSNIVTSLFLPQGTNALKQLDGKYVAEIIEHAHEITGKKIVVSGDSYGAATALLGARQWQSRKHGNAYLVGAVLFTPYTFSYIPSLGKAPEYMPVIYSTNIPLMIYQAEISGTTNQFESLLEKLQQHGNPVYVRQMPGIMSLFYQEPPTREMIRNADLIPGNIKKVIPLLEKHKVPEEPVALEKGGDPESGIDVYLKPFKGNKMPAKIKLKNIHGDTVDRSDYKGKVTLINFWATWCPPCVEEIPSLNRLKNKMAGKPFDLVSINYAEEQAVVRDFMKSVNVEFPVLLDHSGETAKKWNVISYPSTFLIDKKGVIRFGVNAAIEWDSPEIIQEITSMF